MNESTSKGRGRLFLALFSVWLLFAAANSQQISIPDRRTDEENIRETVVRHQMGEWFRGGDKSEKEAKDETEKAIAKEMNFKVFFVSINGKDPSDDLIKRLQDIPRKVKKVSACEISKQWRMAVLGKETGARGIIFSADAIHWLSKDSVEVEGGYHCDGLCGLGVIFKLSRKSGKWIIEGERVLWIS